MGRLDAARRLADFADTQCGLNFNEKVIAYALASMAQSLLFIAENLKDDSAVIYYPDETSGATWDVGWPSQE